MRSKARSWRAHMTLAWSEGTDQLAAAKFLECIEWRIQ